MTIPPTRKNSLYCNKVKQIASQNKISLSLLRFRIKNGLSPYKAATTVKLSKDEQFDLCRSKRKFKYPREYVKLAISNGISETLFYYRVNKLKLSYYEAATKPLLNRSKYMTQKNKTSYWRKDNRMIFKKRNNIVVKD